MSDLPDPTEIINQATPPGFPNVLVIGHGAGQVTVYSQQIRALNLIWALNAQRQLEGDHIVVVGGGVAGVTAAAAAMLHGARVTILERSEELLHLQRGCHTRHLHPRIYEWPDRSARRAGAGLPILDWSVGTASEVAERMLADFYSIRLRVEERYDCQKIIEVITSVGDVRLSENRTSISWPEPRPDGADERRQIDGARAIVLALGFGIERTKNDLPRRSYWRVDSLTQTQLDSEDPNYVVLIAGTGDGGTIDVLRAKLKEFDHGGFLDECMLRLVAFEEKEDLRQKLDWIESNAPRNEGDTAVSKWLREQYSGIPELTLVDDLLQHVRPQTRVIWLGRTPHPLSLNTQLLNRVLGWRLSERGHVEYTQGDLEAVKILDQEDTAGFRYEAIVTQAAATRRIRAHQVVTRVGSASALERWFPEVYGALRELPRPAQVAALHDLVHLAYAKRYDELNKGRRAPDRRSNMKLRAKPEYFVDRIDEGKRYYRIWIWLEFGWALEHVSWVDYDLHPEYGAVHRRAMRMRAPQESQHFRHWINTRDDFWIRVRCADGVEFGAWLSDAVEQTDANGDPALKERCVKDLREEAAKMRSREYRAVPWSQYVDLSGAG
jgi:hypothetical protein